jgi:hypothetical protein
MRAPRFPLQLSVRYRQIGAGEWRVGRTENISRSGVFFCADDPVEIDAPVELRLAMPMIASGNEPAEIWCRGHVVRAVTQEGAHTHVGYAVAIDQYDIVPASACFLTES